MSDANAAGRDNGHPAARFFMLLFGLLRRLIRTGRLTLIDAAGIAHNFGPDESPAVTIRLHDRRLYHRLFVNPDLYLGESYMDGTLTIEQGSIYELLHICTINHDALRHHPLQRLRQRLDRIWKSVQQHNPHYRARANVAHHYDLSDSLYDLFLSADRQYSCAYFPTGTETLEEAQHRKQIHLGAKLLLRPGLKVLDIGSGWGGLGLFLAQAENVDVTGVTLSKEQLKYARERTAAAGLASRVRFELRDYRDTNGSYDRIVSVGMFEHVGARHYGEFFGKVRDLLSPDGVAVVHAIGRMSEPATMSPWIRKYIFPGAYCPSLSEVLTAVEQSGLWVTDIEVLRLHYAETLREWSRRFSRHRGRIQALYDERFCRMWEFYLAASEVAFRNLDQMVFQIQLARSKDAVPLTRDYIHEWEQQYSENSMTPEAARGHG